MVAIRRIACSLLVLLGALAIPPPATAQEKIRLGLLPFSESLGAVIAERQGFFKAEGLEVEVTKFESGALAVRQALGDSWNEGITIRALGMAYCGLGRFEDPHLRSRPQLAGDTGLRDRVVGVDTDGRSLHVVSSPGLS